MAMSQSPVPTSVSLDTVAKLSPGRSTLLVRSGQSTFALQSGASGEGVIELRDGKPIPTALTPASIARSLSMPQARGQISALAASDDGRLVFCFSGVHGQRPFVAVGTFNPVTSEVFTPIDQFSFEAIDRDFITSTARPFLHVSGDDASIVRVEGDAVRLISIRSFRSLQPEISARKVELGSIKDAIVRSAWEWSAAPQHGEFYLTDTASRWIRLLDANGSIRHVARFDESVRSLSPTAFDAAGRVVVLTSDADGINRALLIQDGDAFKSIAVEHFSGGEIDRRALRCDRLVPVIGQANQFLAYDATSGRVVRLTLGR